MKTKEINYTTKDKSLNIKLVYIVKSQYKLTHFGKSFSKHTQCVLYYNGLIKSSGTVVKHANDKDDPKYAYVYATKKAFDSINIKWIRKELWKLIHEAIENGYLD